MFPWVLKLIEKRRIGWGVHISLGLIVEFHRELDAPAISMDVAYSPTYVRTMLENKREELYLHTIL